MIKESLNPMNTEQNYVAQDNCANPSTQPSQFPFSAEAIAKVRDKSITVNTNLFLVQAETMELIQDFMVAYRTSAVIDSVNDLLFRWLTNLGSDLEKPANKTQLHTALQLVQFLTELHEKSAEWEYFFNQTKEGGATNG